MKTLQRRTTRTKSESKFVKKALSLRESINESSIHRDNNPFVDESTTANQYVSFFGNYEAFPLRIVGILMKARQVLKDLEGVADEIDENIAEELGKSLPQDMVDKLRPKLGRDPTHYDVFVCSVSSAFKIDPRDLDIHLFTHEFLYRLEHTFSFDVSVEQAAGSLYALETTAIVELQTLRVMAADLYSKVYESTEVPFEETMLCKFLDMHTDVFEQDHSDGLLEKLEPHIKTEDQISKFERGFNLVIANMNVWWSQLHAVATFNLGRAF